MLIELPRRDGWGRRDLDWILFFFFFLLLLMWLRSKDRSRCPTTLSSYASTIICDTRCRDIGPIWDEDLSVQLQVRLTRIWSQSSFLLLTLTWRCQRVRKYRSDSARLTNWVTRTVDALDTGAHVGIVYLIRVLLGSAKSCRCLQQIEIRRHQKLEQAIRTLRVSTSAQIYSNSSRSYFVTEGYHEDVNGVAVTATSDVSYILRYERIVQGAWILYVLIKSWDLSRGHRHSELKDYHWVYTFFFFSLELVHWIDFWTPQSTPHKWIHDRSRPSNFTRNESLGNDDLIVEKSDTLWRSRALFHRRWVYWKQTLWHRVELTTGTPSCNLTA